MLCIFVLLNVVGDSILKEQHEGDMVFREDWLHSDFCCSHRSVYQALVWMVK